MNWDHSIFLAHAKEDKEQVRDIYKKLRIAGLSPWLDEEELSPGVDWDMQIRNAVKKSSFFIAFISTKSVEKTGYYQRELRLALSHMEERPPETVYIIPALLSDIPFPDITVGTVNLSRYQAVRLYPPHEEKEFSRLIHVLNKEIQQLDKIKKVEKNILVERELGAEIINFEDIPLENKCEELDKEFAEKFFQDLDLIGRRVWRIVTREIKGGLSFGLVKWKNTNLHIERSISTTEMGYQDVKYDGILIDGNTARKLFFRKNERLYLAPTGIELHKILFKWKDTSHIWFPDK